MADLSTAQRLSALPRRDWREQVTPEICERLSALLRAPGGSQTLRRTQAAALLEASAPSARGLFLNGRMGIGKTLVAALLPTVRRCDRALILCPGGILKEFKAHIGSYVEHWRLRPDFDVRSYQWVSRLPARGGSLRELFGGRGPAMIIADEADKLKNIGPQGSALALQIEDWLVQEPSTFFAAMTATCDVNGLLDYGHLIYWALRSGCPLPTDYSELCQWSQALDDEEPLPLRWVARALGLQEETPLSDVRAAYRRRLHETPGLIVDDTPFTDVPLTLRFEVVRDRSPEHVAAWQVLRELHQRPDGTNAEDGDEGPGGEGAAGEPDRVLGRTIWPVARRAARGLWYLWRPPPPPEWLKARAGYLRWVADMKERRAALTEAVARQYAEEHAIREWLAWRAVESDYQGQQVTHWTSTAVLDACKRWGSGGPGVIWTDDVAFAARLSAETGWRYFGQRGRSADGMFIEDGPRPSGDVVIASRAANGEGRNLQYQWHRCLFVAPPTRSRPFDQAVGRLHREGQTRPVEATFLLACIEDWAAIVTLRHSAVRTGECLYEQKARTLDWSGLPKVPEGGGFAFDSVHGAG